MARTDSQQDAYLASQEYADKQAALAEERKRESGFYQGTSTSAKNGPGAPGPIAYTEEGYREAGGYRGNSRTGGAGPGAPAYSSPESIGLPPSNPDAPKLIDDPNDNPNNPGPTLPIKPDYIPPKVVIPGVPIVPVKPKVEEIKPKVEEIKPKEIDSNTRDAFAMLTDLFNSYGLESLAGEIADYMSKGFTASEALIKLKTNATGAYAKRFAGNFTRVKNGLNAISEAEYINLENSYASTLKAYGLGNMVSVNRDDNYKTFANYIAGDISAVEFKDRVSTVVTRVQNADPSIKATLKSFYPEISDADLVGYFLNPKENLPKLQEKVTASEIGAAAIGAGAGLTTNVGTATSLARYGIDQATAREGYSTIAGILPTAGKLGDIYGESGVKYGQVEGEAEVFMGRQDAATKRNRLASMERGSFSGSAGNAPGAYSTSYLKKSSAAGLI